MPTSFHNALNSASVYAGPISSSIYTNDTGVSPASHGSEPSGGGIVSYRALAGSDIYAKANASGASTLMSLPAGTLPLPAFPVSLKISTGGGLIGAGSARTILAQPATASSGATDPTAKGATNQNWLLVGQTNGIVFQDFQIQGTSQTLDPYNTYNGVELYRTTSPVMTRVKLISASPGNDKAPPGETFGISMYGCTNGTFTDVEIDGSATAYSNSGASLFATNSQAGTVQYTRCYAHDGNYSAGWAFWQTIGNVTLTDCVVDQCRCFWNVERCGGSITLIRPRIGTLHAATSGWDPINNPNKSSAIGIYAECGNVYTTQAQAQGFTFTIQDPRNLDGSPYTGSKITVQFASAYDNSGNAITNYYNNSNFYATDGSGNDIKSSLYTFIGG